MVVTAVGRGSRPDGRGGGKTWNTGPHPTTRGTPHFRESSGTQMSVVRRLRNPDLEITSVCLTTFSSIYVSLAISSIYIHLFICHLSLCLLINFIYLSSIYLLFTYLSSICVLTYQCHLSIIYHLSIIPLFICHLSLCLPIYVICLCHHLSTYIMTEMSITSDMQMTQPLWQKAKRN